MQELVYKNGQAGVTKATVSIIFDNHDKKQKPLGYDHDEITIARQVVVGGKNKYMINGVNVPANRVQDLFRSVSLNVNNPHFLIMQGRITKVLNMKPPEILGMIEEAVGTMMFETKKQQAQRTIEKKDAKLREINDVSSELFYSIYFLRIKSCVLISTKISCILYMYNTCDKSLFIDISLDDRVQCIYQIYLSFLLLLIKRHTKLVCIKSVTFNFKSVPLRYVIK